MWRVLGSQPGQLGTGGVMETKTSPFPVQALHCVAPLGCPAAQSLAQAHIPSVVLWVSGLKLVSVRGMAFSQD